MKTKSRLSGLKYDFSHGVVFHVFHVSTVFIFTRECFPYF